MARTSHEPTREKIFECPSLTGWNNAVYRPVRGTYGSNRTVAADGRSLAELQRPAELVAYADARLPWLDDLVGYYIHCRLARHPGCVGYTASGCTSCGSNPTQWHNDGINLVYADGHAKWSRKEQSYYKNWLVNINETSPKWNCPITVHPNACNNPGV